MKVIELMEILSKCNKESDIMMIDKNNCINFIREVDKDIKLFSDDEYTCVALKHNK